VNSKELMVEWPPRYDTTGRDSTRAQAASMWPHVSTVVRR